MAYVRRNAIAGREFSSWADFEAHLVRWSREVADLSTWEISGHLPGRILLAKAVSLRQHAIHHQGMALVHEHMPSHREVR